MIKTNKDFDLALVKVQATDLPALSLGADKDLMLGEEIFAIGTPLDTELGQSVSRGVLSGRREIEGFNTHFAIAGAFRGRAPARNPCVAPR